MEVVGVKLTCADGDFPVLVWHFVKAKGGGQCVFVGRFDVQAQFVDAVAAVVGFVNIVVSGVADVMEIEWFVIWTIIVAVGAWSSGEGALVLSPSVCLVAANGVVVYMSVSRINSGLQAEDTVAAVYGMQCVSEGGVFGLS